MQSSPGSISKAALDGSDPRALEAVDMFLSILGLEAGFMGLRLLATGGIYICGGIGPKVPHCAVSHRAASRHAADSCEPIDLQPHCIY